MKEFKASPHFTSRVMREIRAYEAARNRKRDRIEQLLSTKAARYGLSAGGALLGLINLARIYFSLLAPAICK